MELYNPIVNVDNGILYEIEYIIILE